MYKFRKPIDKRFLRCYYKRTKGLTNLPYIQIATHKASPMWEIQARRRQASSAGTYRGTEKQEPVFKGRKARTETQRQEPAEKGRQKDRNAEAETCSESKERQREKSRNAYKKKEEHHVQIRTAGRKRKDYV